MSSDTLLIFESESSIRLDKFLAAAVSEDETLTLSRERIQQLIGEGQVCVNHNVTSKPSYKLVPGDQVALNLPEAEPIQLIPESIPLEILFEDEHLLVVNKPAGMLTHPHGQQQSGTLVNALLAHCTQADGSTSLSGINGLIRPGIVHRLDKDTRGLLMVAKTDQAHQHLSAQLKEKTARRNYIAIAQGVPDTMHPNAELHAKNTNPASRLAKLHQPALPVFSESGTIDMPIGRNPKHREKMQVFTDPDCVENGKARNAITHWQVEKVLGDKFSWVSLSLETGRTHQIRAHLSYLGHPILGDVLYGSGIEKILTGKHPRLSPLLSQGQCLQAVRLRFTHPKTSEPMQFEIAPDDHLIQLWDELTTII